MAEDFFTQGLNFNSTQFTTPLYSVFEYDFIDKNTRVMARKKIGIFDSGIGGYTLLKEMVSDYPDVEFFYVADNEWAPYGDKTPEQVQERSLAIVHKLLEQQVDLIVVACNTATSLSIEKLRDEFDLPFVGVEPFVNAINKLSFDFSKDKIAVLTTSAMYESSRFQNLLKKYDPQQQLHPLKVPQLATVIEKLYQQGVNEEGKKELAQELEQLVSGDFTHAILGCTHYPLIGEYLLNQLGIQPISPCPHVSERVGTLLLASKKEQAFTREIEHYWFLETRHNTWEKLSKHQLPKSLKF